jgi:hypothetical protein
VSHGPRSRAEHGQTLTACRWLLTLTVDQLSSEARSVAAVTIARAQAAVHQYRAALASLDQAGFPAGLASNRQDTLSARDWQATWLREIGRLDSAIDLFEALLADRQRVLGADHPDTLGSRNNLAGAYRGGGGPGQGDPAVRADAGRLRRSPRADASDDPQSARRP